MRNVISHRLKPFPARDRIRIQKSYISFVCTATSVCLKNCCEVYSKIRYAIIRVRQRKSSKQTILYRAARLNHAPFSKQIVPIYLFCFVCFITK